jgi:hypothetical protein
LRVYHEAMLETRGSATVRHRGAGMEGELRSSERTAMDGLVAKRRAPGRDDRAGSGAMDGFLRERDE